jgi:hypothetical protein
MLTYADAALDAQARVSALEGFSDAESKEVDTEVRRAVASTAEFALTLHVYCLRHGASESSGRFYARVC